MVDKHKRDTQCGSGGDAKANITIGVGPDASQKPQPSGEHEKPKPTNKAHYGEYIIWFLIVAGLVILPFWKTSRWFLDEHSGMVSAMGTIAIMLLTAVYVRYSRNQWRVMDKQADIAAQQAAISGSALRLQEASQRQWVNFQDWQIWLDKGKGSAIRVRFHIVNPTNIPLALDRMSTTCKIGGGTEKVQESAMGDVLAPGNPQIYDVIIPLSSGQIDKLKSFFLIDIVMMTVNGAVIFTDASQSQWEQTFERYVWCGKSKFFEGQTQNIAPSVRQTANGLRKIPT